MRTDTIKKSNLRITDIPEWKERRKPTAYSNSWWEFPKPITKTGSFNPRSEENTQLSQSKMASPKPITLKLSKFNDKERMLKAAREKTIVTYKKPFRLSSDFFSRNYIS